MTESANEKSNPEILEAARRIRNGAVVAFPTETVYGLGANALDAHAVARIFEIKRRPHFDPLIVHVASIEEATSLVTESGWTKPAERLAAMFWPGPLTIVLPKRDHVPDIVTSGLSTVAVRIPDHPLALGLLEAAEVPMAAPSANRFGSVSPTTAQHVRDSLGEDVDLILDGGPCRAGVESTIIAFGHREDASDGRRPAILRVGALSLEEIEDCIGHVDRESDRGAHLPPQAPGMLATHYATATALCFIPRLEAPRSSIENLGIEPGARVGVLCFNDPAAIPLENLAAVEVLSERGDLREAAANLFAAMRRLDAHGLDVILTHEFPEHGVGIAINDRLRRAAHRRHRGSSA